MKVSVNSNNWVNLLLALAYVWAETAYFGYNLIPKSGAEMACDGIALLLVIATSERLAQTTHLVDQKAKT